MTTTISFDTAMTYISFEIYDVDSGASWDDQVKVYAIDNNGDPIAGANIAITNTNPIDHTVTTDGTVTTIDANGHAAAAVSGRGA